MLNVVRSSLTNLPSALPQANVQTGGIADQDVQMVYTEDNTQDYLDEDGTWEYDANEIVFDDTGDGAGVEGDLDVEDD